LVAQVNSSSNNPSASRCIRHGTGRVYSETRPGGKTAIELLRRAADHQTAKNLQGGIMMTYGVTLMFFIISLLTYATAVLGDEVVVTNTVKKTKIKNCILFPTGWSVSRGAKIMCRDKLDKQWRIVDLRGQWQVSETSKSASNFKEVYVDDTKIGVNAAACFCIFSRVKDVVYKECNWDLKTTDQALPKIQCLNPSINKVKRLHPVGGWRTINDWEIISDHNPRCNPCENYSFSSRGLPQVFRGD
jgi:hypothetical protein